MTKGMIATTVPKIPASVHSSCSGWLSLQIATVWRKLTKKESESPGNCFKQSANVSCATRLFPNTSFASHPNAIPGEVLRQSCSGDAATSARLKENGASLLFSFKVRQTGIFISGSCLTCRVAQMSLQCDSVRRTGPGQTTPLVDSQRERRAK